MSPRQGDSGPSPHERRPQRRGETLERRQEQREQRLERVAERHERHAVQRAQHARGRDSEATRKAILTAAEEIFARDGFAGARVDAIAGASGFNKALLFHYFGDKLGLYREIVCMRRDETEHEIGAMLQRAAGDPALPLDRARVRHLIETAMRWSFDHFLDHPRFRCIMAWEIADNWQTFREAKQSSPAFTWVAPLLGFIAHAQEAKILRPELDPKMMLTHVMGMPLIYLLSIPRYELLFPGERLDSPDALAHAREQMVALAVHALMTDSPEGDEENFDAAGL